MRYTFEWDPIKAKGNVRKHGVTFESAAELFVDPVAVSIADDSHGEGEERWVTIGRNTPGVILIVVHTFVETSIDESRVRIISARKAARTEGKHYEGS